MLLAAKILAGLVLFIHVYIFLLETVLFDTRGRKVFGLTKENAAIMKPAMDLLDAEIKAVQRQGLLEAKQQIKKAGDERAAR